MRWRFGRSHTSNEDPFDVALRKYRDGLLGPQEFVRPKVNMAVLVGLVVGIGTLANEALRTPGWRSLPSIVLGALLVLVGPAVLPVRLTLRSRLLVAVPLSLGWALFLVVSAPTFPLDASAVVAPPQAPETRDPSSGSTRASPTVAPTSAPPSTTSPTPPPRATPRALLEDVYPEKERETCVVELPSRGSPVPAPEDVRTFLARANRLQLDQLVRLQLLFAQHADAQTDEELQKRLAPQIRTELMRAWRAQALGCVWQGAFGYFVVRRYHGDPEAARNEQAVQLSALCAVRVTSATAEAWYVTSHDERWPKARDRNDDEQDPGTPRTQTYIVERVAGSEFGFLIVAWTTVGLPSCG